MPTAVRLSLVTATPSFARTRCKECEQLILTGQRLVSQADGFRHLGCQVVSTGRELRL